jgi:hypothetical protein
VNAAAGACVVVTIDESGAAWLGVFSIGVDVTEAVRGSAIAVGCAVFGKAASGGAGVRAAAATVVLLASLNAGSAGNPESTAVAGSSASVSGTTLAAALL